MRVKISSVTGSGTPSVESVARSLIRLPSVTEASRSHLGSGRGGCGYFCKRVERRRSAGTVRMRCSICRASG